MINIIYIPLDERPCNALYPIEAAKVAKNLDILSPTKDLFGYKKNAGKVEQLWKFIDKHSYLADAAVLSTEMLLYGGLVPSRIHYLNNIEIEKYENNIRELKRKCPSLKLYISNLIMRTPRYNSSDEEPDYYAEHGENIFKYGWLIDKQARISLNEDEEQELEFIKQEIPQEYIDDYEGRRKFNLSVNEKNIQLVKEGIIDFLVIPQDDSAEFGYTAIDQNIVYQKINLQQLNDKIMVYPGADEVGWTLLARAYNEKKQRAPKVFSFFSSTLGPTIVPLYEDRIMNESLKAHIMAAGCLSVTNIEDCDFVLAYNTPGKFMQESWDQFTKKDITYTTYRHLLSFVEKIEGYILQGKPVILCDSAFANGGDLELLQLLDKKRILANLTSYKAWNTNCNSLGSSLSAGIFAMENPNTEQIKQNILMHVYEDSFYQSIIRMDLTEALLPQLKINYFDLDNKSKQVLEVIKDETIKYHKIYLSNSFPSTDSIEVKLETPWNRMFEIYCAVQINN